MDATVVLAYRSKERGSQALDKVRCAAESNGGEMMPVDISF
jgi:hypothetical protein